MERTSDPKDIGRLLRDWTSKHYFTGEGWTADVTRALVFPDEAEAMRACQAHDLHDVEVVVWVPSTRTEVAVTPAVRTET